MWKRALGAIVLIGLAGCKPAAGNAPAPTNASVANTAPATAFANAAPATAAPAAAAPSGPSFQITVTLTPAAASRLQSRGQDIIVSADVYGQANAQGAKLADEEGQIDLAGEVRVTMPAAGTITIPVPPLNQSLFPDIQGEPQMLINVFSGEGLNPDNKLDCGLFQDRLALAEQSGIQIACKLIGET